MIDRRGDQLGKVLVCVHAVTVQHRGEAGSLDEEVAIASTPSSVRLVSSLRIDWVDVIEIFFGLLRGVQIYEPNEVRIKTSRSGGHKRQKPEITLKQVVELAMFCDLVARRLLNRAISVFESETQGAVDFLHATAETLMLEREVHD